MSLCDRAGLTPLPPSRKDGGIFDWGEEIRRCPFLNFKVSGLKFSLTPLFMWGAARKRALPFLLMNPLTYVIN
jgi:hypothetical protein